MAEKIEMSEEPVFIKKYANRRLYNTASSTYVTLNHLAAMVKDDIDFVVSDAKSGEDITRSVLTQIIVEEETKGQTLLPIGFLRNLISFYGDNLQAIVPHYLEQSMRAFAENQNQLRDQMNGPLDGLFPFPNFGELGKQNMAIFNQAMQMFLPQSGDMGSDPDEPEKKKKNSRAESEMDELRNSLKRMQQQLDELVSNQRQSD